MLDVLAAVLSHGESTSEIGKRGGETRVSQVFIAIDVVALSRAGADHSTCSLRLTTSLLLARTS
jgi:LDH2 family malate/lactate/ureidoglycolate dehydrogenase